MNYDLGLIHELCAELGFRSQLRGESVEIELRNGVTLYFQNAKEDCAVGFKGTPSHSHDNVMFMDSQSSYIEMNYLDIVSGLKDGSILVGELWNRDELKDRWLIHCNYNDEFKYMQEGEEIRVWRADAT